jgi:hypothetical protein
MSLVELVQFSLERRLVFVASCGVMKSQKMGEGRYRREMKGFRK